MTDPGAPATEQHSGFFARLKRGSRFLRPSHEHSAYSATLLLMAAVMLSRVIGYFREAYIAWAFGAGPATDAYVAAFTLPDWLNYLVAGGTASITFISIFTRYSSEGRQEEAQRAFDSVITVMTFALVGLVVIAEFFAPQIIAWYFRGFSQEQLELCVRLTRVLLPAQIFFYVGGIVSAVLLSKRLFLYPALGPLLYNASIILGGVLLSHQFGIASLAYGAVAGAFIGPFFINALGAGQAGMRYHPSFNARHPGFREWVRLSIPLMLGVSLVAADEWIMRFFASGGAGDITRLNYAKRLFAVPIAVLGQATGQASLPFFARLFGERRHTELASAVSQSVYRVSAAGFLASAWMMSAALPLVDLVYRRGRLTLEDSLEIAVFFFWFALSLAFWAAQALYARAFYAAGNTLTPMLAGTAVTAASIPIYWWFFQRYSTTGLAIASNIGIMAHTVVIAVLLSRKKLVPVSAMPWLELGKALATAAGAGLASYYVSRIVVLDGSRQADFAALGLATTTWAGAVALGLWATRSKLLSDLRGKR
jgi:putative peptidoglycan lipid II flippase